jgi:hypothetical protein
MWDFSYRISGRIVAAITEQKADLPSTRSPRFPKSSRHRSEKHWREKNAGKKTKQENFRTPPEITFSAAKLSTRKRLLGVCVLVLRFESNHGLLRVHERRRGLLDCAALSKQLKINISQHRAVCAPNTVLSPPTHTRTHTHTLQLVTNIADDSCEKLISFHVHQVGCDVGVARNFSARLDESRRFSILHSRLD